ncbi:MAG: CRTAC1 family protein [Microthrixaceae bacterium]|nr:CRTAC1 family protein [Microthrixaceae bacterium]
MMDSQRKRLGRRLSSTPNRSSNRSAQGTRSLLIKAALAVAALVLLSTSCTTSKSPSESNSDSGTVHDRKQIDTQGLHFTNVSKQAGLTAKQSPRPFFGEDSMTSGAAVADVNDDGFDDIFVTRAGLPNILYINNGDGTFRDSTADAGLAEPEPTYGSSAAAFFDADGDGHLDLLTTAFGRGQNRLYICNGDGTFSDASIERGIVFPTLPADREVAQMHGVSVGDVNGDGTLDVLVLQWYTDGLSDYATDAYKLAEERGLDDPSQLDACTVSQLMDEVEQSRRDHGYKASPTSSNPGSLSRLFINDGSGHFTDGTEAWGLQLDRVLAFTGVFLDYDGDGHQDLAITGDGCSSRIYRNIEGQRFEDVSAEAFPRTDENAMGSVITDVNGDGLPDWLMSSISYGKPGDRCPVGGSLVGCSGNRLYVNNGDGTFRDDTSKSGLRDGGWGWGIAVEDFTNRGTKQVAMTNGYRMKPSTGQDPNSADDASNPYQQFMTRFYSDPTRFWMVDNKGNWMDVAKQVGITDNGLGHALVPFDFDNDGDLDILIAQSNEAPILYRNDSASNSSWLTIRLEDTTNPGNRHGEGARVEVFEDNEAKVDQQAGPRVGWITSGGSYESQKPAELHLGFGKRRKPIARVDVYWPGASSPQTLSDIELDQRLVIKRD